MIPQPGPRQRILGWRPTRSTVRFVCAHGRTSMLAVPRGSQLHAMRGTRQPRPAVRGIVLRLEVEHLPRPTKPPQPLWFWWDGPTPTDLAEVWRAYISRLPIEHTFRFFKRTLVLQCHLETKAR